MKKFYILIVFIFMSYEMSANNKLIDFDSIRDKSVDVRIMADFGASLCGRGSSSNLDKNVYGKGEIFLDFIPYAFNGGFKDFVLLGAPAVYSSFLFDSSKNMNLEFGICFPFNFIAMGLKNYDKEFYLSLVLKPELLFYFSEAFGLSIEAYMSYDKKFSNFKGENYLSGGIELGIVYNPTRKARKKRIENEDKAYAVELRNIREAEEKRNKEKAEQEQARKEKINKQIEEERMNDFNIALSLNTIKGWIVYSKKWENYNSQNVEVEKILQKQYGIEKILKFENDSVENPYGFRKDVLYYSDSVEVLQWITESSFIAETYNKNYNKQIIHIRNAYSFNNENKENLYVIDKYVKSAYLKYLGTFEYTSTSGAFSIIPSFDIVLSYE